jgi:hypothetical protein
VSVRRGVAGGRAEGHERGTLVTPLPGADQVEVLLA